MNGRRERLERVVADLQSGKIQPVDQGPRATGSRSVSETAAPGDVGRQPRGLMWEPRALEALEQLAEHVPAAARDGLEAMERMASTGFNYGRLTRKGVLWYLPRPKLGRFYLDDGRTLIVVDVVDARRLRELP